MTRKRIISLDVSEYTYAQATERIMEWGRSHTPSYVCFANVHMVIEGHWSADFARMVNQAAIVAPDGVPLAKAFRLLYKKKQERVAGMDMLPSLLAACEATDMSVFFFGSTEETLQAMKERMQQDYPRLRVAGMFSPPFGSLTPENNEKYVRMINESGANLVMVALGCPKQETWMAKHSHQINAVLLGVGGAFGVYAGLQKRAPEWMQKVALEWFYRLAQEPRRMFKRYFVTNSMYLWLLSRQMMRGNR